MSEYTISVKVPFTYDGDEGGLIHIGLAYVLDAIAEHGMGGSPAEATVKIKKIKKGAQ